MKKNRIALFLVLALVLSLFGAMSATAEASALEPVTLKWYVPSGSTTSISPDGFDAVIEKINSITEPAINAKVDLQIVDVGNFDNKMQMVIASGEPYDLTYTCNWLNPFISNVSKGAYAPLNDLLPEYGKTLLEETPEFAWDAVTVDGQIYAMHCRQNWNRSEGIYVRKDLADKYGFAPEGIVTMEELEELYAKMREGEPADFYPTYVDANYRWPYYLVTYGFEEVAGRNLPVAYRLGQEGYQLVNQFATEEFKEYCEMMRRWNEKGYIRSDSATYSLTADNYNNDLRAGKIGTSQLGFVAPHVKAMAESSWDNKYEAVAAQTTQGWIDNNMIQSSLTAVGINSANKERAVMLYDLVVSNPELYNTMIWGVEGVNFKKVSDNQIQVIPNTGYGNGTQVISDWACGHQFNGWVLDTQDPDIWEQVQASSDAGQPSAILGFVFNPENVKTEIANCSAVVNEQLRLLDTGSVDVESGLNEFLSRLQTAGSDVILAEAQRQLDEWVAANK